MKLSEIKGKAALDTLADLIEPIMTITADEEIVKAYQSKVPMPEFVRKLLKTHSNEVITILALLDGADPASYEVNMITLPRKLLEVLNDPEIKALFF